MTRFEQHLRSARDRSFVGRAAETAAFRAALAGDRVFTVLFLHGAGGSGKTTLLHHYAVEAERGDRRVVRLEPGDTTEAFPSAPVLLIDEFERWQPLESWLREEFLPSLPVGTVVVVAARTAPRVEWTADPGWHDVVQVLEVKDLSPAEAGMLLERSSVAEPRRAFLLEIAGGHPLALRLAVEAAGAGRSDDEVALSVAQGVLRWVVGDLPSAAHRRVLEVCAFAETTTEQLLRGTLDDGDTVESFRWLCTLPFVDCGPDGVRLRPFVRHAVRTELRWRDAVRHDALLARIERGSGRGTPGAAESLPRSDFDAAVRAALRSWRRPDLLATNPLAYSRMAAGPDPVAALRAVLELTLDEMGEDPRQRKAHRALTATYLGGAHTQEAAAERLGLPFSTYRRHLIRGLEVLCSLLWRREIYSVELA